MKKVIAIHLFVLNCVAGRQTEETVGDSDVQVEKSCSCKEKSSWQAGQLHRRRRNRPAFHFTQDEQTV